MVYKYIASTAGLPENQIKHVQTLGRETLPANAPSSYFAIANKCTHGSSLAKGIPDNTCIRCPALGPCSICGPASRWKGS